MFRRKAAEAQGAVPTLAPSEAGAGAGSFGRLVAQISSSGEPQVSRLVPSFLLARLTSAWHCSTYSRSTYPPVPLFLPSFPNSTSNSCVPSCVGQSTATNHSKAVLHYPTWQKLTVGDPCCAPGRCIALLSDCNARRLPKALSSHSTVSKLAQSFCHVGPCKTGTR